MIDGTEKTQIPSKFAKHAAIAAILIDLYLNYNNYDHRNESYRAVLSFATAYYAVHGGSNF